MAAPRRPEEQGQGSGLRTKYVPRSRIGQGLISVAPWVDVVLLIVFFLLVGSRVVLQPGVVVALPEGPFTEGTRPGLIAVVLSVGGEGGRREEIVFFDDERFRMGDVRQLMHMATDAGMRRVNLAEKPR
jgi:biopolymer transport protein ExbD